MIEVILHSGRSLNAGNLQLKEYCPALVIGAGLYNNKTAVSNTIFCHLQACELH